MYAKLMERFDRLLREMVQRNPPQTTKEANDERVASEQPKDKKRV